MNLDFRDDSESVVRSQLKAWMTEIEVLSRDPLVREFAELRQKIDDVDVSFDGAVAPSVPNRSSPFQPYDAYDAFEFGRDLAARELSTLELSKLAHGRFPEWSNESRRFMIDYLVQNGVAEVTRTTSAGRPTRYRFRALGNGGVAERRIRLGVPDNELSALKGEDLDDLVPRTPSKASP